uniref:Translation initiation factor IF-3 n=1 Tax=Candidatus Aschnera chinzeii TaxID=1485666 RepID=A0AAT9G4X8_9ENTR|nr:MAG: translation initiation factor IF-3 [Candidatus Aschnera chinzeii]
MIRHNRINYNIHASTVRLTGVNGEQLGIVALKQALSKAADLGLDLVEINPQAEPPVCKIMNYGKLIYQKHKIIKEQKKKQKIIQIKEIKFRPNTDESDYQVKIRSLIRFLEDGNKTKITLRFRGREMIHQQIAINMLNRIKSDLNDISVVEYFPTKIEGRQMIMMLAPKKSNK